MWNFLGLNKKEKIQPKFCKTCGCELEIKWKWIEEWAGSYFIDLSPNSEYDDQTGIGKAPMGEYLICKNWGYGGHTAIATGNIKQEVVSSGCK